MTITKFSANSAHDKVLEKAQSRWAEPSGGSFLLFFAATECCADHVRTLLAVAQIVFLFFDDLRAIAFAPFL